MKWSEIYFIVYHKNKTRNNDKNKQHKQCTMGGFIAKKPISNSLADGGKKNKFTCHKAELKYLI